jgi:hypothetical protein
MSKQAVRGGETRGITTTRTMYQPRPDQGSRLVCMRGALTPRGVSTLSEPLLSVMASSELLHRGRGTGGSPSYICVAKESPS